MTAVTRNLVKLGSRDMITLKGRQARPRQRATQIIAEHSRGLDATKLIDTASVPADGCV